MKPAAEIVKPIDQFETESGRQIVIAPWFDLFGKSPKLDRLWHECEMARLKCAMGNNPFDIKLDKNKCPSEDELIFYSGAMLDQTVSGGHRAGEYLKKNCGCFPIHNPFMFALLDKAEGDGNYKAYLVAREGLRKSIAYYLGEVVWTPGSISNES